MKVEHRTSNIEHRNQVERSGFSLLELLVAMFVVVFLAGLLLAAVMTLRESARRREAQTQVASLVNALKAYRAEFGRWPAQSQGETDETYVDNTAVIAALLNNPRQLEFLRVNRGDRDSDGKLVDPWARAYVLALDANADGRVEINAGTLETTVEGDSVAVFSWGKDPAIPEGRICSWQ